MKPEDLHISQNKLQRLADFFNEVGMLRHTPRSGFPFLGSGKENVAEHSYRTSVIGFALARMSGVDASRVVFLCLFHDLHEARTGDFNYVNHRYNTCRAKDALRDATIGTGLQDEIVAYWEEMEKGDSIEAKLANDADQLDLICNLQVELSKGNTFAREWLDSALKRLVTPLARELAETILRTDPANWWYGQVEKDWWIHRGREK